MVPRIDGLLRTNLTPANRSSGVARSLTTAGWVSADRADARWRRRRQNARHDRVRQRSARSHKRKAAERRTGDGRDLRRAAGDRGRPLQRALRRDQRQQRRERRAFERAGDAEHEGRDEDLDYRQPAADRRRRRETAPISTSAIWQSLHDALALEAVRGVAGDEQQQRRRQKLHQPDHAELERAAGHVVDLPADRDRADLAGEPRKAARQQKEQERSVLEQVAGTDDGRNGRHRWSGG